MLLFLFANKSEAVTENYQNFLWEPSNKSAVTQASEVVIDDKGSSSISISFPDATSWRVLASSCNGSWSGEQDSNYRYWLQYKNEWTKDPSGLSYKLEDVSNWDVSYSEPVPGYTTVVSVNTYGKHKMDKCYPVGFVYSFRPGILIPTFNAKLVLERASAYPGKYNIQVPFWWGYEENKGSGNTSFMGWHKFGYVLAQQAPSYVNVPVTVTSKCNFNTSPINLSHGTMTGRNADGNQTKPYNLNVTCTPGTSLSVKLLGTQKVSGKTDNYTQCGTGGACELTFDNGKYDETMTIDNSKTLSIKSTYRLNDITKPVAESFEGNGILQVLVN
ncbi:spore coat protein U domain-containing protein [Escherichia marmotae]|uniref:spore coat protein U domain-containing protein n=1 Tax=Escherichia marmotae TaxID=1499973 RepID=UPI002F2D7EF7